MAFQSLSKDFAQTMPKKLLQVRKFDGGLNNNSSATDIADNEFQVATDVIVSKLGKVVMMGDMDSGPTNDPSDDTKAFVPGRNLFAYDNDRDGDGTLSPCSNYIALNSTVLRHWDSNDETWRNIETGLTSNGEFDFQVIDGIVRYSDGAFSVGNARGWWGYVSRVHFTGATPGGSEISFTGMYQNAANIVKPVRALVGRAQHTCIAGGTTTLNANGDAQAEFNDWGAEIAAARTASTEYTAVNIDDTNAAVIITAFVDNDSLTTATHSGSWDNGDEYSIWPPSGGILLNCTVSSSSDIGSIPDGTYKVGVTFVYDGLQESNVLEAGGELALGGSNYNYLSNVDIRFRSDSAAPGYDERISGARVYLRDKSDKSRSWHLMYDVNFTDGWRFALDNDYESSVGAATVFEEYNATTATFDDFIKIAVDNYTSLSATTYQTINGYSPSEAIDVEYKTSAVVNGILYVGNIRQDGKYFPDRMIKCASVRDGIAYDVFPASNFIDIATSDGDEIVKLESFADKVLQFKKKTLYIVNYSEEVGDFVEREYYGMGIEHPAHAFKTPHGIVFINKGGCYLYNGQDLTNLTAKIDDRFDKGAITYSAGAMTNPLAGNTLLNSIESFETSGDHDMAECPEFFYWDANFGQCRHNETHQFLGNMNYDGGYGATGTSMAGMNFQSGFTDFNSPPPATTGNWVWNPDCGDLGCWEDTGAN